MRSETEVESRFRTCSVKISLTLIYLKVLNRVIYLLKEDQPGSWQLLTGVEMECKKNFPVFTLVS